jgi:S-adenosylmethionine decarboxylase
MQGLHLTADLTQCQCDAHWLTDGARLLAYCVQATLAAGLQPVNQLAHTFAAITQGPGGVTATVLLAESHYVCTLGPSRAELLWMCMCATLALTTRTRPTI